MTLDDEAPAAGTMRAALLDRFGTQQACGSA